MTYSELERHWSHVFNCWYIVGTTTSTGEYYYLWTEQDTEEDEVPADAIENPECMHGAIIGTVAEIIDDIENCVGSFRDHGTEAQQEEAQAIVDMMKEVLQC